MHDIGVLRGIREDEVEIMRLWRNAPSVRLNMYTKHEIGIEEHQAWWERIRQRDDQKYLMYEVAGVPSGIVGFNNIDMNNQNSFWAFYASPDAPRGTGANMEFLAIDHAFDILKLHKLSCEVLAFNTTVIKLHKKFGFIVEGVFRQHHKIEEQFVDVFRLGLLSTEWSGVRANMLAKIKKLSRK